MQAILGDCPELRVCVVGDGVLREYLKKQFSHDSRIEFTGDLGIHAVRNILRKSRVFISGCETEALGIAYLEALSQGCSVVMPACGGGLEIAPELIGRQVQLMPLSFAHDDVKNAILLGLKYCGAATSLSDYEAKKVASEYLKVAINIP